VMTSIKPSGALADVLRKAVPLSAEADQGRLPMPLAGGTTSLP
jgi:hypothetical protein